MKSVNKKLLTVDIIFFTLASIVYILQSIVLVCFVVDFLNLQQAPENEVLIGFSVALAKVFYILFSLVNSINFGLVFIFSSILCKKKNKFAIVSLIINIMYVVTTIITLIIMGVLV